MVGIRGRNRILRSCLWAASCSALIAVRAAGQQPPDEAKPEAITASRKPLSPPGLQPGVAPPVNPATFEIGPEDVIEIQVWKEPELSGQLVVRPDGMISASLVGEVRASGRTPDQLQRALTEEYGKVINDPVVMVRMAEIRSSKYFVTGNVRNPGMYPLVVPTRVLEAIVMAGGMTEFADTKKVVLLRNGGEREFFNYNEVTKGKKLEQNVLLKNGDFIIIN